jgi:HlyD family secretion protein
MKDKRLIIIPVLLIAVAAAWLLLRNRNNDGGGIEASGTVEATEADLGFQIGGRITAIGAREGEVVSQGAELARLDRAELEARLRARKAQVAAARALLSELRTGARPQEERQANAEVDAARRRAEDAATSLARTRKLFEGGAVSKEALDQAETAYAVLRAQAVQAQQQSSLVSSGPRTERIQVQQAVLDQALAAEAQIQANLDNTIIRAPFSGIVTVRHREPGESVAAGLPVVTLMNPLDRWVRIYVRENQVGRVAIGQNASITSDSHPGKTFNGRVTFIASQAEFTPRNVQTAEERVKLVYAVKVAIAGDAANQLKPGVPADVLLEAPRGE